MQVEKISFETIDSTSTWAKQHLTKLAPGTIHIVRAEEQTAGYGRRGHNWLSPKGKNLLVTFAFALTDEIPSLLCHKLCLSLTQTLENFSLSAKIKWPNDVLLNGKKIAGVICEIVNGIAYLGLGLNVNTSSEELAPITPPATSLLSESGKEWDRDTLEAKILANFLQVKGFSKADYEKRLTFIDQKISVEDEGKVFTGICKGISEEGALLLEVDGKIMSLLTGQLSR